MKEINGIFRLLHKAVDFVEMNDELLITVVGGYKIKPNFIRLANFLNSTLNMTSSLTRHDYFGHLVPTSFFIEDSKKIFENPELIQIFMQLWAPVIERVIKPGSSSATLCKLPMNAADKYTRINDNVLECWIYLIITIKKKWIFFCKKRKMKFINKLRMKQIS